MSPDLEKKLYEKYPNIFVQKDLPMSQTNMCWGLDIGDGWYNIIDGLCDQIESHLNYIKRQNKYRKEDGREEIEFVQVEATQVKEKFGTLRFYINYSDDFIDGLISMAEMISSTTCESCGNIGKQNNDGWIRTLCDPCRENRENRTTS